jgi:RNase P subunit RPR2
MQCTVFLQLMNTEPTAKQATSPPNASPQTQAKPSRKGCLVRRWSNPEKQILKEMIEAGMTDQQIYESRKLDREIYMIGYARRRFFPDFVDTERQKNGLKAVKICPREEAQLVALLKERYLQWPDWYFSWRFCVSRVRIVRLRLQNGMAREFETAAGHAVYSMKKSASHQRVTRERAERERVQLRRTLREQAASDSLPDVESRHCTKCKEVWPATEKYFLTKNDIRKAKRYLRHRCRCCGPPVKHQYSTGPIVQLVAPWLRLYQGLQSAYPTLVGLSTEMKLVDYKRFRLHFTRPRRFDVYRTAYAVLASAKACGIPASVQRLDFLYFGDNHALAEVITLIEQSQEQEISWRQEDRVDEEDCFVPGEKAEALLKAIYALLSLPKAIVDNMV